jgi:hypothetical protein
MKTHTRVTDTRVSGAGGAVFSRALAPGWKVTFEMEAAPPSFDRMVVARLHILPTGDVPPSGITAQVLSAIRIAPARRYAALCSRKLPKTTKPGAKRGRPPRLTPQFYRRVWRRYLELLRQGAPDPAKQLATEEGYKRSAMRAVLHRCRHPKDGAQFLKED